MIPGKRIDVALVVLLAASAFYLTWILTGLDGHIPWLVDLKADDVWFEADVRRVFKNMTLRNSNHYRTQVHPLFSLVGMAGTRFFAAFGANALAGVRLTICSTAAIWIALFYFLLRTLRCRQLDATVFSMVAASSAAAVFWTSVPETYLFGSATIVLVLLVTALADRRSIPAWLDVGMSAASLSMTTTNFMFGLISLSVRHRLLRAVQLAVNAFMVVVVLWTIEKYWAPSAHFFLGDHEQLYHDRFEPLALLRAFFVNTMVMPETQSVPNDYAWLWAKVSVQHALNYDRAGTGIVAVVAWIGLLAGGAWAMVNIDSLHRFRLVLVMGIAGQLTLHSVYGNELFLYTLNWLPLLVVVTALASQTRLRWFSLVAAVIFIACAAHHNYLELRRTLDTVSVSRT